MATTKTTPRGRARTARADDGAPDAPDEVVNEQDGEPNNAGEPKNDSEPKNDGKPANAAGAASELLNISDLKDMSISELTHIAKEMGI